MQPSNIGSLSSKRGKGRPGRSHAFVKEQTVDTKWGPAILVDEFEGGWNCDYGDQYDKLFFLETHELHAIAAPAMAVSAAGTKSKSSSKKKRKKKRMI